MELFVPFQFVGNSCLLYAGRVCFKKHCMSDIVGRTSVMMKVYLF